MTTIHSNKTLQRIVTLRAQIRILEKHLERGEHVAAGLTVELGIGANDGHPTNLELAWDTDVILKAFRDSVFKSLRYYEKSAHDELKELQLFLGTDEKGKP